MKKTIAFTFSAILFLISVLSQASHAQVILDGGEIDIDGVFGSGGNTSYFVFDFSGSPDTATGPRDSYIFEYLWDDLGTTAADGLLDIDDSSELVDISTGDFGSPGEPDLFVTSVRVGDDFDQPDFGVDSRFLEFFVSNLSDGVVFGGPAQVGISNIVLQDGTFVGVRGNVFVEDGSGSIAPQIPFVAVPEPSAVILLGFAVMAGGIRRRRRG